MNNTASIWVLLYLTEISSGVNNVAKVNMWMAALRNPDLEENERNAIIEEMRQAYYEAKHYDESTNDTQDKIERNFNTLVNGILSNQQEQDALNKSIDSLSGAIQALEKAITNSQVTLQTAKANEINAADAKNLFTGATYKDLKEQGKYTAVDFKQAGISYSNAKSAGFNRQELWDAGYEAEVNKEIQDEKAAEAAKMARDKAASDAAATAAAAAELQQNRKQAYQNALAQIRSKGSRFTLSDIEQTVKPAANAAGYTAAKYLPDIVAGSGSPTWEELLKVLKGHWSKERLASTFSSDAFIKAYNKVYGKNSYTKYKGKGKPYKTGGLADYTGPAWLDGTPSKPELVLNAQDTKNFIALKDVLSKAIGSTSSVENTSNNATFEININVDHLNNDYDVDKVVERVKKKIVQDSSYRNVTQVRKFR